MTGVELACLALAVYFEARNQDVMGQIAVAQVVMNRVESDRFPDEICDVVFQPAQFSFYWDGKSDTPYEERAWKLARGVARNVASGTLKFDALNEVLHYHATYVSPRWARSMKVAVEIGDHVFYYEA